LAGGIDLGFDACSTPAQVIGDRLLLEELLGNLIDNAIRYVGHDGEATVRVDQAYGDTVLKVEDNGPGIPMAERAQVLERFQRGSTISQIPGSGLGLSIVREIAVTHGAKLQLETGQNGRGTRVSVTFPRPG
jgi:two-component system sensor histidine kinase TctE